MKINPGDAFAVVLLSNCEAKLGRHAEVERHAAEATVLAPNNGDSGHLLDSGDPRYVPPLESDTGEPGIQQSILFAQERDDVGLLTMEPAAQD